MPFLLLKCPNDKIRRSTSQNNSRRLNSGHIQIIGEKTLPWTIKNGDLKLNYGHFQTPDEKMGHWTSIAYLCLNSDNSQVF